MTNKILKICFAVCRSIPVLFIVALIVWSYYVYVIQLCFGTIKHPLHKIICLVIYHPIFIMFIWSYWKTIFTPVSFPPKQFCVPVSVVTQLDEDVDRVQRRNILLNAFQKLPVLGRTMTGELRYCDRCKCIKPDRAHHCSICGRCILKMDHHCPWINNCVCFANYKFFVLFLFYGELYCLYIVLTSVQYFVAFFKKDESAGITLSIHIVFIFFAASMFCFSLLLLGSYHIFLILKNRTSIESIQTPVLITGPDTNAYNLGFYENFINVFGKRKLYWFLPIFTSSGNGITYPLKTPQNIDDANLHLLAQSFDDDSSGDTEEGDDAVGADDKYDSKVFW